MITIAPVYNNKGILLKNFLQISPIAKRVFATFSSSATPLPIK